MRTKMLTSVAAAALLLTAGAVSAQTTKQDEAPSRAPAAQQEAPAEKMAPSMKAGENKAGEHKSTTGEAAPEKAAPHSAQTKERSKSTTGAASKNEERNEKSEMKGKSTTGAGTEKSDSRMEEHGKNAGTSERNEHSTVSQGSAAGMNKLSTEQRTKVTTVIREHKVAPTHLNVSIRVGTRIPESVHLYPVPAQVIEIYPEWRGFDYVYVGDQILVISPRTHEIVAILEA